MHFLLSAPLRFARKSRLLQLPLLRSSGAIWPIRNMAQEYRLNGISKDDLKKGEKREVEVEGIEGGKVLLVKVGDKTHALGPNCTHYGAPLKNGVLTPDGRLTCPWHGG